MEIEERTNDIPGTELGSRGVRLKNMSLIVVIAESATNPGKFKVCIYTTHPIKSMLRLINGEAYFSTAITRTADPDQRGMFGPFASKLFGCTLRLF